MSLPVCNVFRLLPSIFCKDKAMSVFSREPTHPIPVVFNLSSWAQRRQPLTAWLIEELEAKYQIPRKISPGWINTDQILPLLDGLDEMIGSALWHGK